MKRRALCIAVCSETPGTGESPIAYSLSLWHGNRRNEINRSEFLASGLDQQYVQNWLHHLQPQSYSQNHSRTKGNDNSNTGLIFREAHDASSDDDAQEWGIHPACAAATQLPVRELTRSSLGYCCCFTINVAEGSRRPKWHSRRIFRLLNHSGTFKRFTRVCESNCSSQPGSAQFLKSAKWVLMLTTLKMLLNPFKVNLAIYQQKG